MFGIYRILKHSVEFDSTDLEFFKIVDSLKEFNQKVHHISKYSLVNNGWCFIMRKPSPYNKNEMESFAEFLLIDISSDRIIREDLLPLVRDLKLHEILN